MKKLVLGIVFTVLAMSSLSAQGNLNAGINLGLPIGDADDGWTFNISLDLNYLWQVSDGFDAGIATGYSHSLGDSIDFFGESVKVDDVGFLPIAAAGRFNVSEKFTLGADLGYAIGISPSDMESGFYYAPRIQYGVSESIDIVFAYRGVSLDGGSFDVLTLGVEFGL
jgi:opacity protein-like surface antigen